MIAFLTYHWWLGVPTHRLFLKEIAKLHYEVEMITPQDIVLEAGERCITFRHKDGRPFSPDLVFHRVRRTPGHEIIYLFEEAGFRLVNSTRAWRICNDKALQSVTFSAHGLPHPRTLFALDGRSLGGPGVTLPEKWVTKPVHGRRGRGVQVGGESGRRLPPTQPRELKAPDYDNLPLVQDFIDHPSQPRHHIRCNVIGGRAVLAGRLFAADDKVITNQAQGGRWEAYDEIPGEVSALAERAALAVGADYTGVDLISDDLGRLFVLECNEMPDLGLASIPKMASFLVEEATKARKTS